MAKSRKEKRLARKQKAEEQVQNLRTSEEARFNQVYELGRQVIDKKWSDGQGLSRHQAKKEGDVYRYITSRKAYRDALANWRRFSQFVAKRSVGDDLDGLESILKYADRYIQSCVDKDLSAWTLTTYKAHLGKVFDLPTTAFIPTKSRRRADAKRSRQDVESDKHISQEKKDFFEMVGGATGLRKSELQSIKGSALETERDVDGFYYFRVQGKGGKWRRSPLVARNEEEERLIVSLFRQNEDFYVFNNRVNEVQTYAVPKKLDEHSSRAEYAKRVYLLNERDVTVLPKSQKTFLRKELKGHVLDKRAELAASKALGHERVDEFRKSYAYKLVK